MPGTIPQHFIDELLTRADIVDVIGRRVPLKKAGRDFQACCPFHTEKTPSFTVSPSKQFYHCFGCGAHGSALGFLMEYDRLSYPEAIEELAGSLGLEVPREAGFDQGPDHRPLLDILEQAARHFGQQLRQHADAPRAIDYLRGRGVSGEVAATFQIGFAPPGWDNLLTALGKDAAQIQLLRDAGLITEHDDGKRYDRLRDRIIFPIRNTRGRVIGFGGRLLGEGKPKYLNSPETAVFHKGRELYGLYESRQATANPQRLLVVEGYMDVVALAQFGIDNAVATMGTATTPEHLEKLYRAAPEVVFCFDGDRAGRDAAWKALQTALPLMRDGRQARFLFLPDGEDPDSLVRRVGAEAMQQRIGEAQPLSGFLFDKLAAQVDMDSIDGRARFGELATPLLERLPAGMFREMMRQALHEKLGLPAATVSRARNTPPRRPAIARPQGSISPIRRAVALVLQRPELAALELPTGWQGLDAPGIELLQQLIETARTQAGINSAALVERYEDPAVRQQLARLAVLDLGILDDADEQLIGSLRTLAAEQVRRERELLLGKSRLSPLSEEEKQRLRELYRSPGAKNSK